jgi:hypothetical protein
VFYVQAVHQVVRRQCVEFIQKNEHKFQEVIDFELVCCPMASGLHERGGTKSNRGKKVSELRYW